MDPDQRRQQIIAHAQHLFLTRGYERTSIAEIIAGVGIAKGTFYHYFTSKTDLLHGILDAWVDQILASLASVVDAPGQSAIQRMEAYFRQSFLLKAEDPGLITISLGQLYREENARLRAGLQERTEELVGEHLTSIIRQGNAAGSFNTPHPDMAGPLLLRYLSACSEGIARAILAVPSDRVESNRSSLLDRTMQYVDFMEWTLAQILAVSNHRFQIVDRDRLQKLIQSIQDEREASP